MTRFALPLLFALSCSWLSAEDPAPAKQAEAAAVQEAEARLAGTLIRQLSSDSFVERTQAKSRLLRLGRPALEPLEAAAKSDDCETRLSALEILIALRGRGFLGVQMQEVNPALEARGRAATAAPIYLQAVSVLGSEQYRPKGSPKLYPAEIAGLKAGDKFVSVNGHLVHGTKDLMREIIATGPARIASLEIERDGKLLRLPVLLTRNPVNKSTALINQMLIQDDQPPPVDLEKAGSKP